MAHLLTQSGVRKLLEPEGSGRNDPITVQVLHLKTVVSPQGERFRVVLSDGEQYAQGMFSSQLNHMVAEHRLQPNGLIRIEEYMTNSVADKPLIILLRAQILPNNPGVRIGSPVDCSARSQQISAPPQSIAPLYNNTSQMPKDKPVTVSPSNSSPSNPYGRSSTTSSSMPMTTSSAPIVRSNTTNSLFTSIADLNLYQSRWTIQARIAHKSEIRTWSNAKGEGSLFSIDLVDSSGSDIRATFFKEAVDRFYNQLVEGNIYTFSGGKLKVANAKWNNCKSPHEITFDQNSEIHLCSQATIQDAPYDFVENIASLESLSVEDEKQINIDLLAYVQSVGEVSSLVSKKQGKEFTKCDVNLVDDSEAQITVTLWGDQAYKAKSTFPVGEMVAVRRARLSGYGGGKSLSGPRQVARASDDSSVVRSPAYGRLLEWHRRTNGQVKTSRNLSGSAGAGFGGPATLTERKSIADIRREHLGYQSEKGDFITVLATVSYLKKDKEGGAWYPACPNDKEPCKSRCKVTPTATGGMGDSWSCERCNGTYPNCVRRWIFSGVIEDTSGSTWVTFFDDHAQTLFGGATADEVFQRSADGIPSDPYDSTFAKAAYTEWIIKARCKLEAVPDGGDSRVKASVQSIHPVNYVQESKDLLAAIAQF